MAQLFESVMLALASIWANKLRSVLTLLGNIVAVSSIITVVALLTGVNEAVSDAIVSDLGADSFTVQRTGITQNEDDFERMRSNPRVTVEEAEAIKRFATTIESVMAQAQTSSPVTYKNAEIAPVQVQGVSEEYLDFATFDAERGRMITPTEIRRNRYVTLIGWGVADRLFGPEDPLDKKVKVAGVPYTVVGVSKKKGAAFGQSLDDFVVIPLGAYQRRYGSRQSLSLMIKPRDASLASLAQDESELGDTLAEPGDGPAGLFERHEMRQLLAEAINSMGDREKWVLMLYYYEHFTLAEIGRVLGVTESRVCQIHTKSVMQLRLYLNRKLSDDAAA